MKRFITPIVLLTLFMATATAQVKKLQPKVYSSNTQKILKGTLADATEEIVHHKVIVKVLLNKFEFLYPNHELNDVVVKMTQAEWVEGVKEQDYVITSHPEIKEIYFIKEENKIWLDFKDGTTIIYTLSVPRPNPKQK